MYGDADPELTVDVSGLVPGDDPDLIAYTVSREEGETVGTYTINVTGETAQGNYLVDYDPATLTIVPEDTVVVTITAHSDTILYDGKVHDLSGYDVTTNNALYTANDFAFNTESESSVLKGTNAGTYSTSMKAEEFTNINDNFENVVFVVENGKLEINRREVVLTSGDAEKVYDGEALTNNRITVTGDGFVDGEAPTYTVTGRITRPGEAENTFTYAMTADAGNYNIRTVFGTLRVTEGVKHRLTIRYVDEEGDKVFDPFIRYYATGETYTVVSEQMDGYRPDIATVTGTMNDEDVSITVTYHPVTYSLTITFESVTDGKEVADPIVLQLRLGETYTVVVPKVDGYTGPAVVTGVMQATTPSERTVLMTPVDGNAPAGADTPVELGDYGTPLGVADSILGGGEVIE